MSVKWAFAEKSLDLLSDVTTVRVVLSTLQC